MKSKLLLACTILFFCSSFLCGQNQTSKVANSAETNNGAVRHPWQGKRVGYLGDSITDPNCYGDKIKKYWDSCRNGWGLLLMYMVSAADNGMMCPVRPRN